jgi:hypothetical protein
MDATTRRGVFDSLRTWTWMPATSADMTSASLHFVIAALVAAIPIQSAKPRDVNRDARHKAGHDGSCPFAKIRKHLK